MDMETKTVPRIDMKTEAKTRERANESVNGRTISFWLRIDKWITDTMS